MPDRPDSLVLVYDGDSGLRAMLLDAAKKAVGREECALCEITHSPLGKRRAWAACEARLGVAVTNLHRDQLPEAWGVASTQLPCILARVGDALPRVLLTRDEIAACRGNVEALERHLLDALSRVSSVGPGSSVEVRPVLSAPPA